MKIFTFLRTFTFLCAMLLLTGSGWGQYDGTGTFQQITSLEELESGTYYVFYGISGSYTGAMTNTISGGRMGNTTVTVTGANIVDPSAAVVWLVEGNDTDGYTVFNEAENKYCEITTNSTSGFSFNDISTHTYDVSLSAGAFTFASNHESGGTRAISIYQSDWRPYVSPNTLHLYKLTESEVSLLIVNPTSLTSLDYTLDAGPSTPQSFELSGTNLDDSDVTITAPTNFEVATSGEGTYSGSVTLTAFDGTATDIWVRLVSGLAIDGYSGNVTISGGGAGDVQVAVSGSVSDPNLNVEDFANYPETGTSYNTGTFLGQDGSTWNYVKCAGPTAGHINAPTPLLGRNQTPSSEIYSGTINGGIGTLSFEYKQAFSTGVDLNIFVNDVLVGNVTSSSQEGVILNSGDITVNVAGGFVLKFAQNGSGGQVSVDNVTWTPYSTGANVPPSITNIVQSPASGITSSTTVSVSADVTDSDGTIEEVELRWGTTSGALNTTIPMSLASGDTYTTNSDIPAQTAGINVYYEIYALDNDAGDATSVEQSYIVVDEPTNHVTNFSASSNSYNEITLSWTDADAEAYLIKGSTVGFGDISAPADGTAEADDDLVLVKNVLTGVQGHSFIGLDPETTHYFKIFPYNGSEETINYKANETVPEISATTDALPSGYFVNFEGESETKGAYASGTVNLSGLNWDLTEAVIGTLANDWKYGIRSARLRGYESSSMTMLENKSNGIGTISFQYRRFGTDSQVDWKVEYSTDNGVSWIQIGSDFSAPESDIVQTFSEEVNEEGNVRVRIVRATLDGNSNDNRLNIDDILITDYIIPLTTWKGDGGSSWHTPSNWSDGVPDAGTNAIIPGGVSTYPNIESAASVNNLTLEDGATLLDNGNLTVEGTLIMEKEMPTGPSYRMISAPVSDMDIYGSDFAPAALTAMDMYFFKEDVAESGGQYFPWINIRDGSGDHNTAFDAAFVPGKGYLASYDDGGVKSFRGTPNTGDVGLTISRTSSTIEAIKGWNIIGNPYPSGYAWDGSEYSDILEDVYAYALEGQTYFPVSSGTFPPNQAFFVKKKDDGSGTFTFLDIKRVHVNGFGKEEEMTDKIVLNISNGALTDQANIQLYSGTSFERDVRDALKLYSLDVEERPQIFTFTSDQIQVAINSIPAIDEETVIKVGARVPADGSYSLSVNEISGRFQSSPLYLLDTRNGEIHNLKEHPEYSFQATAGDEPALFELWFTQPTEVPELPVEGLTRIYTHGQTLYMEFGKEMPGRKLEVFDISGRRLIHQSLGTGTEHAAQLNLQTGVYIVRVSSTLETETKRIFVE